LERKRAKAAENSNKLKKAVRSTIWECLPLERKRAKVAGNSSKLKKKQYVA
jgi:hypothetical protein